MPFATILSNLLARKNMRNSGSTQTSVGSYQSSIVARSGFSRPACCRSKTKKHVAYEDQRRLLGEKLLTNDKVVFCGRVMFVKNEGERRASRDQDHAQKCAPASCRRNAGKRSRPAGREDGQSRWHPAVLLDLGADTTHVVASLDPRRWHPNEPAYQSFQERLVY